MIYVQFYGKAVGPGLGKLIEACGSNGVLPLDGRWGWGRCRDAARRACHLRGWTAWQLRRGPSFSNSKAWSDVYKLSAAYPDPGQDVLVQASGLVDHGKV